MTLILADELYELISIQLAELVDHSEANASSAKKQEARARAQSITRTVLLNVKKYGKKLLEERSLTAMKPKKIKKARAPNTVQEHIQNRMNGNDP